MKTNISTKLIEIYAQACSKRAERDHFRVLLGVENEFTYKQLLSLMPIDAEVILIPDGEGILESYLKSAPDLLIVDPALDLGEELFTIYEMDEQHFVTLLADNMSQKEIMDALESGAQGFLTKPYTQRKMTHYLELLRSAKAFRNEQHRSIKTH